MTKIEKAIELLEDAEAQLRKDQTKNIIDELKDFAGSPDMAEHRAGILEAVEIIKANFTWK